MYTLNNSMTGEKVINMAQPSLIDLDQILPAELMEKLHDEARRYQRELSDIVREAIEEYYYEEEEELEDTPDEEVLEGFRRGWHDAMTGNTIPADVALKRLREKLANERN